MRVITSVCGVSRAFWRMFSMNVATSRASGTGYAGGSTIGGGNLRSVYKVGLLSICKCITGSVTSYRSSGSGSVCVSSQNSGSVIFVSAVSLSRTRRCSTVPTEWMSSRWSGSTQVEEPACCCADGKIGGTAASRSLGCGVLRTVLLLPLPLPVSSAVPSDDISL